MTSTWTPAGHSARRLGRRILGSATERPPTVTYRGQIPASRKRTYERDRRCQRRPTSDRAGRPEDADRREGLETDLGEFHRDEVGSCVGVNHGRADVAVAEQPL